MKILLNASGGNFPLRLPLRSALIDAVKEIGLDGIRRDLFIGISSSQLTAIVEQVKRQRKLHWVLLMNHIFDEVAADHARAISHIYPLTNLSIEIGIEASLNKEFQKDPIHYAVRINHMAFNVWTWLPDTPIIATTTGNIDSSSQEFLQELIPFLDRRLEISIHSYRESAFEPSPGYSTVPDMFGALVVTLNGRKWHNTETGWHTATKGNLCRFSKWIAKIVKKKCRLTYEEVGNYLVEEIQLHEASGADSFTIYQAYNGKKDKAEDKYGILEEKTLKLLPSARIVKSYINNRETT